MAGASITVIGVPPVSTCRSDCHFSQLTFVMAKKKAVRCCNVSGYYNLICNLQNNSESSFNADSTRLCALCDRDIQIGFGGEANWQQHLNSTAHRNREASKISKNKAKTTITNFFRKASPPKALPVSAAGPSRLSSIIKGAKPTSPIQKSFDKASTPKASTPPKSVAIPNPLEEATSSSTSLTKSLRHLAVQLPHSFPIAKPTSVISAVTGDPCLLVSDPLEAWEILNPIIHSVFGYQSTANSIAHLVERGPFGLDGFCDWVDACIEKLNVDEALLEPKVLLLLEATQRAYEPLFCCLKLHNERTSPFSVSSTFTHSFSVSHHHLLIHRDLLYYLPVETYTISHPSTLTILIIYHHLRHLLSKTIHLLVKSSTLIPIPFQTCIPVTTPPLYTYLHLLR